MMVFLELRPTNLSGKDSNSCVALNACFAIHIEPSANGATFLFDNQKN
jgi:hypothetical protein